MSIDDILNMPEIAEVNGKSYKIEYDNMAYGVVESMTSKGTFEVQRLIASGKLGLKDSKEVILAGLLKHHENEINEIRGLLDKNLYLITDFNLTVVRAFNKPLLPPDVYKAVVELEEKYRNSEADIKKKI